MELPRELAGLVQRLEQWRNRQGGRKRLPDDIWREAARLGQRYGFSRVAGVLRMSPGVLKSKSAPAGPAFVELALAPAGSDCVLEMETSRGKLRVEMKAMTVASIASLIRTIGE
jgi:hypothetical protein